MFIFKYCKFYSTTTTWPFLSFVAEPVEFVGRFKPLLKSLSLKKSLNITPFMLERLDSQRSKIERRSDLSDVERAKRLKVLEVAESRAYKKISELSNVVDKGNAQSSNNSDITT